MRGCPGGRTALGRGTELRNDLPCAEQWQAVGYVGTQAGARKHNAF